MQSARAAGEAGMQCAAWLGVGPAVGPLLSGEDVRSKRQIAVLFGLQATAIALDLECEIVIPSNDGIQFDLAAFSFPGKSRWAPAFAGVTDC